MRFWSNAYYGLRKHGYHTDIATAVNDVVSVTRCSSSMSSRTFWTRTTTRTIHSPVVFITLVDLILSGGGWIQYLWSWRHRRVVHRRRWWCPSACFTPSTAYYYNIFLRPFFFSDTLARSELLEKNIFIIFIIIITIMNPSLYERPNRILSVYSPYLEKKKFVISRGVEWSECLLIFLLDSNRPKNSTVLLTTCWPLQNNIFRRYIVFGTLTHEILKLR